MESNFSTAGKIIFGPGKISQLPNLISHWGSKAFLVRGKSRLHGTSFYELLDKTGLIITEFSVKGEPDVKTIDQAVSLARKNKCDFVIGFGGGSVIDTGKAVSALLNNEGEPLDYLEVVGKGLPLKHPSRRYIAIPTTAGTGSEVTKNAVISVPDKKVKVSMRSNFMLPDIALVDPEFTYHLPPEIISVTGMDAFIQVIEPFVCNTPDPMVDIFCRDAIPRAAEYLIRAFKDEKDNEARINLSWVSLLGGMALANAKLGAVHGFAGPIGGMFDAPHGAVCASLMPSVMKVNSELLNDRPEQRLVVQRFKEIAKWVTQDNEATIENGVEWFAQLNQKLCIPRLSEFGIQKIDFPSIVEKASQSSSMKGNPIRLDEEEMTRILELAF